MSSAIDPTHTHVEERVAGTSSMASLLTYLSSEEWQEVKKGTERKWKEYIVWSDKTEIPFNILRIIKHTKIRTRSHHTKQKHKIIPYVCCT